ncbi:MAG: hypothetical protein H5T24_01515, partial [Bacteroidales bacterium]|nr:hypothetical protein [Bacteroidales bacterium]
MTGQQDASAAIAATNDKAAQALPFSDTQDFADAERGFVAALTPGVVRKDNGDVAWDSDAFA